MKRYQLIILSFASGIFILTFFGGLLGELFHNVLTKIQKSIVKDFVQTREYNTLQVFFPNSFRDPDNLYCEQTYPVERKITMLTDNDKSKLGELIYLAISKLLDGPTEEDKNEGFFTSINIDTKVKKITVEDNVASVEFDDTLSKGITADSCQSQAIRSQINETLKQFPEIQEVVILVNGKTKGILQP